MAYFYHVCLALALLQGLSLPFLLIISFVLWQRQKQKRKRLKQALDVLLLKELKTRMTPRQARESLKQGLGVSHGDATKYLKNIKSSDISEQILENLPKLKPLKRINCGSGVLLKETETLCAYCGTRGDLPEDYAVAVSLKQEAKESLKSAERHWRVANILTFPLLNRLFICLGVILPLAALLIGSLGGNFLNDLIYNSSLDPVLATLIHLLAIAGVINWTLIFLCLAVTCFELREKLPVFPVFEEKIHRRETATCYACGGALQYDTDDFASICDYCNVKNFRARFARLKRAQTEEQKLQTDFALFGATEIIEHLVTLLYGSTLLFFGVPAFIYIFGLMIYAAVYKLFVLMFVCVVSLAVFYVSGKFLFSKSRNQAAMHAANRLERRRARARARRRT